MGADGDGHLSGSTRGLATLSSMSAPTSATTLCSVQAWSVKRARHRFEPDPAAFDLLMGNVTSNGYRNVILEQKAVSNEEGTLDLYIAEANKGDHRIYQPGGREHVEVEAVSLDGYLANSPGRVDFLKIDTQGAEGAILAGAIDTLTRNQDIVLVVEFWPASMHELGYDPAAVLGTLTDLGFHFSYIDELSGTVTPVDARMVLNNLTVENEKWSNLLCKR